MIRWIVRRKNGLGIRNSLGVISDEILNTHTRYTYDLAGRIVKEEIRENANSDTGALIRKTTYSYEDGTNRLLSRNDTLFGSSKTTTYVYGNQSQNPAVKRQRMCMAINHRIKWLMRYTAYRMTVRIRFTMNMICWADERSA